MKYVISTERGSLFVLLNYADSCKEYCNISDHIDSTHSALSSNIHIICLYSCLLDDGDESLYLKIVDLFYF